MAAPYTVRLATATVTGSSAATISFTSINQNYAHLLVIGSLRSTRAAATSSLGLYFNSDTTSSNYDYARNYYYSSLGSNYARDASSGYIIGYCSAANATSGTFSNIETFIANYAVSGRHYYGTKSGFGDSATLANSRYAHTGNQHAVSTTISAITFVDADGGDFAVGSTLTLLGIKDS